MIKHGVVKNKPQKSPINEDSTTNNIKIITLITTVKTLTNGIPDTDNDNKQTIKNIAHNITCKIVDNKASAANNIGNIQSRMVNGNARKTKHITKNNMTLSNDPIKIAINEQINPSGIKSILPSIDPIVVHIINGGDTAQINRKITIIIEGTIDVKRKINVRNIPITKVPIPPIKGTIRAKYEKAGCVTQEIIHSISSKNGNQSGIHRKNMANIIIQTAAIISNVGTKSGDSNIAIGNKTIPKIEQTAHSVIPKIQCNAQYPRARII